MKLEKDELYIIRNEQELNYFKHLCIRQGIKLTEVVCKMFNLYEQMIDTFLKNELCLVCSYGDDNEMCGVLANDATTIDGVLVDDIFNNIDIDVADFLKVIGCDDYEIECNDTGKRFIKAYKNKECVFCMRLSED